MGGNLNEEVFLFNVVIIAHVDDKEKAFQLVTWSKDMTLRQWKIDSQYLIVSDHCYMQANRNIFTCTHIGNLKPAVRIDEVILL